jgi:NhaA family Na+:H+ antiporter
LRVSTQAKGTVSVVEWLEHKLHPYSAFLVVPIFAMANAGIHVPVDEVGAAFSNRVTWGVMLGLVVGKTIGITLFTLLAVKLKVGRLPVGVTPRYVLGAGALGGIGFTVSLFVTELAFGEQIVGTDARLGVLIASLAAALIGTAIMVPGRVIDDRSMDELRPEPVEAT